MANASPLWCLRRARASPSVAVQRGSGAGPLPSYGHRTHPCRPQREVSTPQERLWIRVRNHDNQPLLTAAAKPHHVPPKTAAFVNEHSAACGRFLCDFVVERVILNTTVFRSPRAVSTRLIFFAVLPLPPTHKHQTSQRRSPKLRLPRIVPYPRAGSAWRQWIQAQSR